MRPSFPELAVAHSERQDKGGQQDGHGDEEDAVEGVGVGLGEAVPDGVGSLPSAEAVRFVMLRATSAPAPIPWTIRNAIIWVISGLRREALLIRVEVRDLRLWPVAAGRCS
jgi:hypothetical protein